MFREVVRSTTANLRLASWGRCFWQDPNDGTLIIVYMQDSSMRIDYSIDSGTTWVNITSQTPANFSVHDNYDSLIDRDGNIHLLYRTASSVIYRSIIKNATASYTANTAVTLAGITPGDTGTVGGVNGSLFMDLSGPTGGSYETATDWPLLRIVVKDNLNRIRAFYSEPSYTVVSEDSDSAGNAGPHDVAVRDAGLNGGFPIMYRYTDGFNDEGMPAITYYCEPTGTLELVTRSFEFNQWTPNADSISTADRDAAVPVLSGVTSISGLAPPSPLMCFGSGIGTSHVFIGNVRNMQTLYSTQSQLTQGTPFDTLIIEPAIADNIRVGPTPVQFGSGDRSFAINRTIHGVHGTSQSPHVAVSGGNTRCDFSFTDDEDEIKFYFQDLDDNTGQQVIKRILATQLSRQSGAPPHWAFAKDNHIASGVKNIARVNATFAGGSGIPCWTNFKALKHPTEPGDGASTKKEMLLLVGHNPATPGGSVDGFLPGVISTFDVDNDPSVNNDLPYPDFSIDYTKTSGNPVGLVDISTFGWENSNNLFDDNLLTYSPVDTAIITGDSVTLEFSKPILVNRIEMLKPDAAESGFLGPIHLPSFSIETSFDGATFTPYKQDLVMLTNYASVNLIKTHGIFSPAAGPSVVSQPEDFTITHTIRPIVGKYIRFTRTAFAVILQAPMRELRLYGPAQVQGEIITGGNQSAFLRFTGPLEQYSTERFNVRHGELPAEVQTKGDFHWFTSASGTWAKAADLPGVIPSSVGLVTSGFWEGDPVGNGDGFAATVPVVPANAGSGVMQSVITVAPGEFFNGGIFNGRPVQFDYRLDMHPGDEFEFTTIKAAGITPPYGDFVSPVSRILLKGVTTSYVTSPDFALSPGRYLLQWEYRRGPQTNTSSAGAAWVDNIRGLDGQPQPSIRGFLRGGTVGESGAIHGFAAGNFLFNESIHGFASGGAVAESIHGYVLGGTIPGPDAAIHGYVDGALANSIHGFLFGNNFLTKTFPTGEIGGFVKTESGITSAIHGHVEVFNFSDIYGFTHGFDDASSSIHGFVDSFDFTSAIHGIVNGSGDNTFTESIHGFVQSRFGIGDQVIHGFVDVPSGVFTDRKGYTQGWEQGPRFFRDPQTMVLGVLPGFQDITTQIHGFMSGGGPVSRIHGYLQGEFTQSGNTSIHGYVKRPSGVFTQINGYVSAGDFMEQIHGYTLGHEPTMESIHGYTAGSTFSSINGYLFGSSGLTTIQSHGYLEAVENPASFIWGVMIGSTSGAVCDAHNFPLSPVPIVTIPTGNFFN